MAAATKEQPQQEQEQAVGGAAEFVEMQLDLADSLKKEKENLYERMGANRELLRNLVTTGMVTEEQAVEIDTLYPRKARKGDEQATDAS